MASIATKNKSKDRSKNEQFHSRQQKTKDKQKKKQKTIDLKLNYNYNYISFLVVKICQSTAAQSTLKSTTKKANCFSTKSTMLKNSEDDFFSK